MTKKIDIFNYNLFKSKKISKLVKYKESIWF